MSNLQTKLKDLSLIILIIGLVAAFYSAIFQVLYYAEVSGFDSPSQLSYAMILASVSLGLLLIWLKLSALSKESDGETADNSRTKLNNFSKTILIIGLVAAFYSAMLQVLYYTGALNSPSQFLYAIILASVSLGLLLIGLKLSAISKESDGDAADNSEVQQA